MENTTNNNYYNEENTEVESAEILTVNETPEKPTFKQKAEAFVEKLTVSYDAFMERFLVVRIICSFTALLASVGFFIMLVDPSATGWIGFFGLLGVGSALIACPLRLLEAFVALVVGGFTIGLAFLGFGCLIGAAIGAAIGLALVVYAPAIVTIPYCWKELMR